MKGLTILSSNGFTNGTPLPDRETMLRLVAEHRKKPASDLVVAYVRVATNMLPSDAQGPSDESLTFLRERVEMVIVIDSHFTKNEAGGAFVDADMIYVEGGNPSYLLWWLNQTDWFGQVTLAESLPKLIGKGKAYVGSSAGAMILGKSVRLTWLSFMKEGGYKKNRHFMPIRGKKQTKGLGLVKKVVHPHFEKKDKCLLWLERLLFGRILPLWEGTYFIVE